MASQWVINNKKVKDWTIGGKKVKSITLANGKVLNFGAPTPSAPTIKASEYTNIQNISNYKLNIISTNNIQKPDITKPFIIEFKDAVPLTPYQTGGKSFYQITNNTNNWSISLYCISSALFFVKGHKYQFENGKDPIDLGTF